mmetsp:Transcript_55346/g.120610  ORF Transcript_55346/g.120610 Transcript_55346/m.120610 type:complete len:162 (-) Transcript_55346:67-552(-)
MWTSGVDVVMATDVYRLGGGPLVVIAVSPVVEHGVAKCQPPHLTCLDGMFAGAKAHGGGTEWGQRHVGWGGGELQDGRQLLESQWSSPRRHITCGRRSQDLLGGDGARRRERESEETSGGASGPGCVDCTLIRESMVWSVRALWTAADLTATTPWSGATKG